MRERDSRACIFICVLEDLRLQTDEETLLQKTMTQTGIRNVVYTTKWDGKSNRIILVLLPSSLLQEAREGRKGREELFSRKKTLVSFASNMSYNIWDFSLSLSSCYVYFEILFRKLNWAHLLRYHLLPTKQEESSSCHDGKSSIVEKKCRINQKKTNESDYIICSINCLQFLSSEGQHQQWYPTFTQKGRHTRDKSHPEKINEYSNVKLVHSSDPMIGQSCWGHRAITIQYLLQLMVSRDEEDIGKRGRNER